jgi:hypothetical protein
MPRVRLDGGLIGSVNNPTASVAGGMWSMKEHEKYSRSSLWPIAVSNVPSDVYFKYNTLLIHGDATGNNTVFVDSSANALTLTTNGKPYQGTYTPFSQTGWSAAFNLSGSTDALATTNFDASLTPGTSDYTIEFWVYPTATSGRQNWFNLQASSGTNRILVYYTGTAISLDIGVSTSATSKISYTVGLSTLAFTWNHIAVSRIGGTTKMFLNGTQIGSDYVVSDNWTAAFKMTTMRDPGGATWGSGYMSNMRYIIGTGLYSANFTPSTTEITSTGSETKLLTLQDSRYYDNGANTQALTLTGTPSIQPFAPFAPTSSYSTSTVGGSIYLNGSTDYLSLTSTAFGIGTSDFTVEFWIYKNNAWSTSDQYIFDNGTSSGMQVWVNTAAGALRLGRSGVDVILDYAYSNLTPNQWYHMAYVRSGTTLSLFVNGSRVATTTSSASFATGSATQNIGRGTQGTGYLNAYLYNLRIVNDSPVYDPTLTTLTVPTAPLSVVNNTTLLLNGTNAGVIDHTAKNNITTFGAAAISSTQSRFNGTSVSFDGTAYLAFAPSNNFTFGAGDFTIEFWLYLNSSGNQSFYDSRPSGTSSTTNYIKLGYITSDLKYETAGVTAISGGALNTGQWYHIALCRSGTSARLFVDGVQKGTTYTDSQSHIVGSNRPIIGADGFNAAANLLNGYLDEIRISKYARYTANFTPPTSTFANQ